VAPDGTSDAAGPHLGRHYPGAETARPRLTTERLRRVVKWLVAEHLADPALLRKSSPRLPADRLMTLVAGLHTANPELTLRGIAGQLERLHERTLRGGSKWSPSSVKNLIDRAQRTGLIDAEPAAAAE